MAMDDPVNSESLRLVDNGVIPCSDVLPLVGNNLRDCEALNLPILEDFDLYMQDIVDRLTISRMVSDSVIKGMVGAVQQEAAVEIAQRELEAAALKKMLNSYHVTVGDGKLVESLPSCRNIGGTQFISHASFSRVLDHDRTRQLLESSRIEAAKQLKELKEELHSVRNISFKDMDSESPLVGLDGPRLEKVSQPWINIDRGLHVLELKLDSFVNWVEDIFHLSKSSLAELQQELEFRAEVEEMVIANSIRSLQEQVLEKLWEQNVHYHQFLNKKMEEFSGLREEIDAFNKLLSASDAGQLVSHGSLETEHLQLQRKLSGSHISPSASLWEGNGKHEELIISTPENLDPQQLMHLKKEELVDYFKDELIKVKRNHESKVQEMTEEIFSLKRDYLRERGSSLPLRKDKDVDILKRKISGVISRLDEILVETKNFPTFKGELEGVYNVKEILDALSLENRQLRDRLIIEKREVKRLSSKVSDAQMEASVSEEVHGCIIKTLTTDMLSLIEDLCMESDIQKLVYEVLCKEAVREAQSSSICKPEILDIESALFQEFSGLVYAHALAEAKEKLNYLNSECIHEKVIRAFLENEVSEKVRLLTVETAEKERLKQEKLLLAQTLEEKGRSAEENARQLAIEKRQFELAKQELDELRGQAHQQHMLVVKISKELEVLNVDLAGALAQNEMYKDEQCKLNEKLRSMREELRETAEARRSLAVLVQEKENSLLQAEANERECIKQLVLSTSVAHEFTKALAELEDKANKGIKGNILRLGDLGSQLISLAQEANEVKSQGLMCKERLEQKCSDLEKAENEVDLLADEVETLLRLLENVYVALDHYSPILQHYPGIMEILKMVKRELSGEAVKSV